MFKLTRRDLVSVLSLTCAAALVAVALAGAFVVGGAAAAVKPAQTPASYLGKASLDNDTGALSVDVKQVVAARGTQTLLLGHDVRLLTGPATRIVDRQGAAVARTLLEDAIVRVQGRLLPTSAWALNDDGEREPTIRANRILVLQLEAPEHDSEDALSPDTSETD
jgi:hypothetical protein